MVVLLVFLAGVVSVYADSIESTECLNLDIKDEEISINNAEEKLEMIEEKDIEDLEYCEKISEVTEGEIYTDEENNLYTVQDGQIVAYASDLETSLEKNDILKKDDAMDAVEYYLYALCKRNTNNGFGLS